jgi:hypothetical protein
VLKADGVYFIFKLCLCNPTTKQLHISAYGVGTPFSAWFVVDLCGVGDEVYEAGAFHQDMMMGGAIEASTLIGKQLPVAHLLILPVAHAPALPLPRHWYLITHSAPPPWATGILFTRGACTLCATANV